MLAQQLTETEEEFVATALERIDLNASSTEHHLIEHIERPKLHDANEIKFPYIADVDSRAQSMASPSLVYCGGTPA